MNAHDFLRDPRLLQPELRLSLEHRLKPGGFRFDRSKPVHFRDHLGVPRWIIARRNAGDVALHLHQPLLLGGDVADDRSQLLHRQLHLGEPSLQRADFVHQSATLLVQLVHIFGHLLELLDARLVVVAVDIHRFHQLVEVLHHRVQASAQRPAAGGALAVLAERHDAIPLLLELDVLLPECFPLGLCFLSVAHPLGAPSLEQSLSVLELGALLLQLERGFLFECRSALDLRVALLQPRDFLAQRCLRLEQRLATTLFAIESVQRLELHVQGEQRLDALAQAVELGSSGLNPFQLSDYALGVAMHRRFLLFGNRDLREELRRLLALALRHLPTRLDGHHLPLANRSAVSRLMGARFCFRLARCRLGQIAQDCLWIGHSALHSVNARSHPVSFLAGELLRDSQLLIAKNPRKKLAALGGRHRRHHAQLFLSGEVGVEELR